MRATFQPTTLCLLAALLAGCPGAPIPPSAHPAALAAPVDSGLLALDAPPGSDGATDPIDASPDPSPAAPGGGSAGGPPPGPPAGGPAPVLIDLHCPDGAALKLAIDAPPSTAAVGYYEGAIYKGWERVGTFTAPAAANHASLELAGLKGGADYTIKLSAFDASHHQLNLNKPAFEAYGPYVMVPGGSLAASVTVPLGSP
jgi:hypothetical protein